MANIGNVTKTLNMWRFRPRDEGDHRRAARLRTRRRLRATSASGANSRRGKTTRTRLDALLAERLLNRLSTTTVPFEARGVAMSHEEVAAPRSPHR
jgi:hypothetical protein